MTNATYKEVNPLATPRMDRRRFALLEASIIDNKLSRDRYFEEKQRNCPKPMTKKEFCDMAKRELGMVCEG